MLKADNDTILLVFRAVHGDMTGNCHAEVVHDPETGDVEGVACMKHGYESWRATLAELVFDLLAAQVARGRA